MRCLVGRAAYLEATGRVAGGGEVDEVSLPAGEGDREAAVPIGARGAVDATDTEVAVTVAFSRLRLRVGDLPRMTSSC
jgi:hypothetical protein